MLIRCPTCASGYDLAPAMLGDGRILRCAHCRDAWVHRADAAVHDGPEIVVQASAGRPAGEPQPRMPRRPAPAVLSMLSAVLSILHGPSRRGPAWGRTGLPAGAAASALAAALLVSAFAAVACKARVVAAFPPSEAVFATLGLPVNLSGLALGELRSSVAGGDGTPTLTLEGRITNLRPGATPVPSLRIAVRDGGGRDLYHWIAPAPKTSLAAGETVVFRSVLAAPPRAGQNLAVSFAEATPERRRLAEVLPSDR